MRTPTICPVCLITLLIGVAGCGAKDAADNASSPKTSRTPPAKGENVVADEMARAKASMNKMHGLLLALVHNENDNQQLLPAVHKSADGKPLLSWRVLLLPYLKRDSLFEKFRLDEPWDSKHNKRLLSSMPDDFRDPGGKPGESTTCYVLPVGPGTMFSEPGISMDKVSSDDGVSSTIMMVELDRQFAVPWTKPADCEYSPKQPTARLAERPGKTFLAGFADGHLERFPLVDDSNPLQVEAIHALFTYNGRDGDKLEHLYQRTR